MCVCDCFHAFIFTLFYFFLLATLERVVLGLFSFFFFSFLFFSRSLFRLSFFSFNVFFFLFTSRSQNLYTFFYIHGDLVIILLLLPLPSSSSSFSSSSSSSSSIFLSSLYYNSYLSYLILSYIFHFLSFSFSQF